MRLGKFIEKSLKETIESTRQEVIDLSDKIESEKGTPDIEEWKAFKCLRNKLRDLCKK